MTVVGTVTVVGSGTGSEIVLVTVTWPPVISTVTDSVIVVIEPPSVSVIVAVWVPHAVSMVVATVTVVVWS